MKDLIHFAAVPLLSVVNTEQARTPSAKPRGLWVSVGESWAKWCLAEAFHTSDLVVLNRVELVSDANVLRLSTAKALDRFTQEYANHEQYRKYASYTEDARFNSRIIEWWRVAEKFDGILIAPYVWARRLELMWYYGWDCASGCIWNARAIASVDALDTRKYVLTDRRVYREGVA